MHDHLFWEELARCPEPCVVLRDFLDRGRLRVEVFLAYIGGFWNTTHWECIHWKMRLVSFSGFWASICSSKPHWISPLKQWSWKEGLVIAESSFTISTAGWSRWVRTISSAAPGMSSIHITASFSLIVWWKPIQPRILWVTMLPFFLASFWGAPRKLDSTSIEEHPHHRNSKESSQDLGWFKTTAVKTTWKKSETSTEHTYKQYKIKVLCFF